MFRFHSKMVILLKTLNYPNLLRETLDGSCENDLEWKWDLHWCFLEAVV